MAKSAYVTALDEIQRAMTAFLKPLGFKKSGRAYTPDAQCTWLLTELDSESGLAFGLCDLGLGCPELGYVSFSELAAVRGKLGLPVERDRDFIADEARAQGRMVT